MKAPRVKTQWTPRMKCQSRSSVLYFRKKERKDLLITTDVRGSFTVYLKYSYYNKTEIDTIN